MEVFYHAGAIISIFLGLLILSSKNKLPHNWLLGIWLIIMGINIFIHHRVIDHETESLLILKINRLLLVLQVPLSFLFAKLYIHKNYYRRNKPYLHFIPFGILLIKIFLFPNTGIQPLNHNADFAQLNWISILVHFYVAVGIPAYAIVALLQIKKLKIQWQSQFSNSEKHYNSWIQRFFIGIIAGWLSFFILWILSINFNEIPSDIPANYSILILSGSLIYLGLFGLHRTDFFVPSTGILSHDEKTDNSNDINTLTKVLHTLQEKMQTDKYYLQPRLSIKELSIKTGISVSQISQSINIVKNQNFYEFINQYRVEAFMNRINNTDYKDYTFEALAYECGFNSKSSFFELFKKHTGLTPGQYIKKIRNTF
jgi:AraC-like DNA-binding protein